MSPAGGPPSTGGAGRRLPGPRAAEVALRWPDACRLVPSRFPPVSLFERVAEGLLRRQNDKFARALFGNIHTSFTQGKGVGAMTTLVSMLAGSSKTPDGKNYLIATEILDMILDNQTAVNDMISLFGELQLLVSQDFVLFDVTLGEFHSIIRDTIYELKPMADLQGHRVVLSDLNPRFVGGRLRLNWEFMRKALKELLLNAFKFSPPQTTVTVRVADPGGLFVTQAFTVAVTAANVARQHRLPGHSGMGDCTMASAVCVEATSAR